MVPLSGIISSLHCMGGYELCEDKQYMPMWKVLVYWLSLCQFAIKPSLFILNSYDIKFGFPRQSNGSTNTVVFDDKLEQDESFSTMY